MTDLAWEISGDASEATPLVWAHGGNSSRTDEDQFALLDFAALSTERKVLRYDAAGHGESEAPSDPKGFGWDQLASDQLELASTVGIDRYVAAGTSLGAGTALHAAVIAPARIDRLVLVLPPTGWAVRDGQSDRYLKMAELVEAEGMAPIIKGSAAMPLPDPLKGNDAVALQRAESVLRLDAEHLAAFYRGTSCANMPSKAQVAQIEAPALVLAWTGDVAHPVAAAEELAELLPNARLSVAGTWDEFRAWTAAVGDFLGATPSEQVRH